MSTTKIMTVLEMAEHAAHNADNPNDVMDMVQNLTKDFSAAEQRVMFLGLKSLAAKMAGYHIRAWYYGRKFIKAMKRG